MMDELIGSQDASELLNMPLTTLGWWIRQGVVKPIFPGRGRGSNRILTLRQVCSIGIARALKQNGARLDLAFEVARVLEGLTTQHIQQAFAEGRTCVLIGDVDGEPNVMPWRRRHSHELYYRAK
jgi:hypothetical protein